MQVLQPSGPSAGYLQIEGSGVEDLLDIHASVAGAQNLGPAIHGLDGPFDTLQGLVIHYVRLVQDDDVCELDLIDHEVRDRSLVLGNDVGVSVGQKVCRFEIRKHGKCIAVCV